MVSSRIAAATGDKAKHILNRGLDKKYYQNMILELVREYGPAGREDIDKLLMNKLPEILTDGQKKAKIHNLISGLRDVHKKVNNYLLSMGRVALHQSIS